MGFGADPIELELGDQTDHLEPVAIDLRSDDAYMRLVKEKLLVTDDGYGRMILFPSFEAEGAVSVYGSDYVKDEYPLRPTKFHITLTRASTSLYHSLPENNERKRRRPVSVKRIDVEIDRDFAVAVQRAWAAMLLNTRYPDKARLGCDGYTAYFSVWVRMGGDLQGKTWSPDRGLPKEMVEIGRELMAYCEVAEKERTDKRKKLMQRLEQFEREAQKARAVGQQKAPGSK